MKYYLLIVTVFYSIICFGQSAAELAEKRVDLPNGWRLTPVGKQLQLGDLPLNIAVSNRGKYAAVTNNGQSTQTIQLFDAKRETLLDEIMIPKSWYGLAFSNNENFLYASGGNDNRIMKYEIKNRKLERADSIYLTENKKETISPTGIALDETAGKLYVGTKDNNSLYIIDLKTKNILDKILLETEVYSCLLSADKKQLYLSGWGTKTVLVYDIAANKISNKINVGSHPNEMCLSKNGKYLFVANADDNSVSIISTENFKVIETLNAALYPEALPGSTSNGLALSKDEKTLYVANADNNCLAVFNVSTPGKSSSKGFIPTGWYPTNVKVINKKIWVANGKGLTSLPNPAGPNPMNLRQAVHYQQADTTGPAKLEYIGGLFKGTMSIIPVPSPAQQGVYSAAVYQNTPYTKIGEMNSGGEAGNPVPARVGDSSPIKYVFYIIKENRTYDQVLGDVPGGNGDSSLVFFGKYYTPNQHKLVDEFVLLDNFYVNAEVSADGHNWSMGAYANDYLEKTWPTSYGGRGGSYDAEGMREIANNKGGFIWDHCKRNGVSYRSYGEFGSKEKANIAALKGHMSPTYEGWNMAVKDTTRFYQWKKEFDSLLSINQVPQFNSLRFGNDHTEGLRKGRPTPYAHVADNDFAVGLFLDHLSHSTIWKQSVVLIVEDDAQNGADHVDAHRSTAYLAGGYVKRNYIDHTMYSSSSFLRTIELILGMPPMTQFDAAATPLWRCFSPVPNTKPFTALMPNVDLNEKNIALNKWQEKSEHFNLAKEDGVPDLEFNEVLWYGLKGESRPFPAPRRSAFLQIKADKDDD